MTLKRAVVVTGVGLVTPHGHDLDTVWTSLRAAPGRGEPARSGHANALVSRVTDLDARPVVGVAAMRYITEPALFGICAAVTAAQDASLERESHAPGRVGVFVGAATRRYSTSGSHGDQLCDAVASSRGPLGLDVSSFAEVGRHSLGPMWCVQNLGVGVLHFIAEKFQALGANANVQQGGVSSTLAVGEAVQAIRQGEIDIAFAGGYDSLVDEHALQRHQAIGVAAVADASEDASGSTCAGPVLSEGAAFLILEDAASARLRHARVYGEVAGFASVYSAPPAGHWGAVRGGIRRSVQNAMSDARIGCVDAVFAHGLGTRQSDAAEADGLRDAFGETMPPVMSLKRTLGHCGAASGAIEMAMALMTMNPSDVSVDGVTDGVTDRSRSTGTPWPATAPDTIILNDANLWGVHASLVMRRP